METALYFVAIVLNLIILLWWKTQCKWYFNDDKPHFPQTGHIILIMLGSLSPIFNLFITGFLITSYTIYRVKDDLQLKYTKLTHTLFGIKKPQEENKEIPTRDPIYSYCNSNYRCPLSNYCKHATTMRDKKTIVKSKFNKETGTCINYIYEGE